MHKTRISEDKSNFINHCSTMLYILYLQTVDKIVDNKFHVTALKIWRLELIALYLRYKIRQESLAKPAEMRESSGAGGLKRKIPHQS